jgi:membrane peptidoglycan carboxypeptidase
VVKYGLILEHDFPKDKILELYFNSIYYGRHAQGFAAAAKIYFHTDPAHLTQAQCYYLTGLPQAPSYFGSDTEAAALRYHHVLSTLERNGYITSTEERRLASSTPE